MRRTGDDAELCGGDQLTAGEDERSLNGILKLADVARPRVRENQIARLSAETRLELAHGTAQLTHEVIREEQHIVASFAQRRQMNTEHREPVVEIFTELRVGHRPLEIAIGGGDEANVGLQRRGAAHALIPPFLQHAQELGLRGRGQLTDLIEKQRTARRELEAAALELVGPGEGSTLVARTRTARTRSGFPAVPRS